MIRLSHRLGKGRTVKSDRLKRCSVEALGFLVPCEPVVGDIIPSGCEQAVRCGEC